MPKTAQKRQQQQQQAVAAAADSVPQSSLVSSAGDGNGDGLSEDGSSSGTVDSDKNILGFRIVAVPQEDAELMVVLKVGWWVRGQVGGWVCRLVGRWASSWFGWVCRLAWAGIGWLAS